MTVLMNIKFLVVILFPVLCLLVYMVKDKSALDLIEDPIHLMSRFPLASFKILSLVFVRLTIMDLGIALLKFIQFRIC